MIDVILVGLAYIVMVYFMVLLMKRKSYRFRDNNDDDDDGGIAVSPSPDLDLPPGITLPDNGPGGKAKKEDKEEAELLA